MVGRLPNYGQPPTRRRRPPAGPTQTERYRWEGRRQPANRSELRANDAIRNHHIAELEHDYCRPYRP